MIDLTTVLPSNKSLQPTPVGVVSSTLRGHVAESLSIMDGFSTILLAVAVVVITAVRHYWSSDPVVRLARQAERAAKSSERAFKASAHLSNLAGGFSTASIEASQRGRQARSHFVGVYWLRRAELLLLCARWFLAGSTRLRDRAKTKLESCDTILDSLGVKRDA